MKKIAFTAAVLTALAITAGCEIFNSDIDMAKEAIQNKDYSSALMYLKDIQEAGTENAEVDLLAGVFEHYLAAVDMYNAGDTEGAKKRLDEIPAEAESYVFWSDIEEVANRIAAEENVEAIDERISRVKQLIASGDYNSAKQELEQLEKAELTEGQQNELAYMSQTIETADAYVQNAERQAEQAQQAQQSANNDVVSKTMYVVKCNEYITLRTSASTSASEITRIPLGASVGYISGADNGFCRVRYGDRTGYVLASYLGDEPEDENSVKKAMVVINCNEFITLRTSPSTSASEITKIPLGRPVGFISEADNGFYKIMYDNKIGYALAYYLADFAQ